MVEQTDVGAARADGAAARRRARRMTRLVASAVLVAALVLAGVGAGVLAAGGAGLALAIGLVLAAGSFAVLGRMATIQAREAARGASVPPQAAEAPVAGVRVASAARRTAPAQPLDVEAGEEPTEAPRVAVHRELWTPEGLPHALHLSDGSSAADEIAREAARAQLRQAAIEQALAEHAATREAQIVRQLPERPAEAAPSRYAGMGVVDGVDYRGPDVADIMRRRRSAG